MKKLIFTAICGCTGLFAFSQTSTIKGIVTDSSKNMPLAYLTVAVTDSLTKQLVKSIQTDDNGSFELTGILYHKYQLSISGIGYKNKLISLIVDKHTIDLGKVKLAQAQNQLKEIAITAAKPTIIQEVDRIVYDVQADPDSKALDALDMMRKVPLLSLDASDHVQLKGSGSYKILINGKESAIMTRNPSDILRSMPANNILRIEVITTPPAKYDAEGLAGIINIVTKTKGPQGYSGTINGRYNNVKGEALNVNSTIQQDKLGIGFYAGAANNGHYNLGFANTQILIPGGSYIVQNGANQNGNKNYSTIINLSYEIDTLNLLTMSFDYVKSLPYLGSNEFSIEFNSAGNLIQQYNLNNTGLVINSGYDVAINYQLGFKKRKEQLFTFSYQYSTSIGAQSTSNLFDNDINFNQPNYRQYNNSGNRNHTFQLDYSQPISKTFSIEAGSKVIARNYFSNFNSNLQNIVTLVYLIDPAQTNNFNYQQNVYSLYNSYQAKSGSWAFKGGWRLERTVIDADFVNTLTTPLQTNYNNLIPSLSLQHKFAHSSINFGFAERIQRPSITQLNPYINLSNPKFISTGNPNLRPELSHSFELNLSNFAKNSFTTGLSYAFSNNSIQNISYLSVQTINKQSDTVTTSTYQNLGSNHRLAYNFYTNLSFAKRLNINANIQLSHLWLNGAYNGQLYSNQGNSGNGYGGISYLSKGGYRASFNIAYTTGEIFLQGTNSHATFTQFLLNKELPGKKLNLSFVAGGPFNRIKTYYTNTRTADYLQTASTQQISRTFAIRLNYKFGKLKNDVKKNKHGIKNDDTADGNNPTGNNN